MSISSAIALTFIAFIVIGLIFFTKRRNAQLKKRFEEGWNLESSFIQPLTERGIPPHITKLFLSLYKSAEPYPFLPDEDVYTAFLWDEEDIVAVMQELTKICNKKMPESKKERQTLAGSIHTVEAFLKTVTCLPDE